MDINTVVSTDFEAFSHDDPISRLVGAFDDPAVNGIVVTDAEDYVGVVTRRQLAGSRHPPEAKVDSLVWHVPRLVPDADVREVARLMLDSDAHVLPVFDGEDLVGVVTVDGLLGLVHEFLDAATVRQLYSRDLVVADPDTTFGEALNTLREHRITHLPVVDDADVVGIVSLSDVTQLAVRPAHRSQGGDPPAFAAGTAPSGGTGSAGGAGGTGGAGSHGGFGAREGERDRMLDLPVRDLMVSPVRTVSPDATLADALDEMTDVGGSSLVVTDADDAPLGIVTKSDLLRALTMETEGGRAVQIVGVELMDDVAYDDLVAMVDRFESLDGDTRVLDAKIHLHAHHETFRGTPLLLARVRLFTDRGLLVAAGEGYGARHALNEARAVMERRIRDEKTYATTKKHPGAAYWERRYGWLLEP